MSDLLIYCYGWVFQLMLNCLQVCNVLNNVLLIQIVEVLEVVVVDDSVGVCVISGNVCFFVVGVDFNEMVEKDLFVILDDICLWLWG